MLIFTFLFIQIILITKQIVFIYIYTWLPYNYGIYLAIKSHNRLSFEARQESIRPKPCHCKISAATAMANAQASDSNTNIHL